ncbi:MAG: C-type lectin-like domain-containing protein, partial [Planctomycetota bacterium]
MRKKNVAVWAIVLSAVMTLALYSTASAAVTTISDAFTEDDATRANGLTLNGVTTQVGGATWDAEDDVVFSQPAGVVTNSAALGAANGIGAAVAYGEHPLGTNYTVKVDVKFQAGGSALPVKFHEVFLISDTAAFNSPEPDGSLYVRLYSNGDLEVRYSPYGSGSIVLDSVTGITLNALTDFNTIELIWEEQKNMAVVKINGLDPFFAATGQTHVTPGMYMPDVDEAGFRCDFYRSDDSDVPIGGVEYDNFVATYDDDTAHTVEVWVGPVVWHGHTYYLLDPSGWATAQAAAEALGGHLVTINSQEEEDYLRGLWDKKDFSALGLTTDGNCDWQDILSDHGLDGFATGLHRVGNYGGPYDPIEWMSGFALDWSSGHPGWPTTSCPVANSPNEVAYMIHSWLPGTKWQMQTASAMAVFSGIVEVDHIIQINSGFNSENLYAIETGATSNPPKPPGDDSINQFNEITGNHVLSYTDPAQNDLRSLTFAGASKDRLFAAKPNAGDPGDIDIIELDSSGTIINSTTLKAIYTASATTYPVDHTAVECWGGLRYNAFHNTLMLAVQSNTAAASSSAYIHHINLALTAVVTTAASAQGYYTVGALPTANDILEIATSGYNGDVYCTAKSLVSSTNGGVVKLDTDGAGDGTVTTLINGGNETGATNPWVQSAGKGKWISYRGFNNVEGKETIVILFGNPNSWTPQQGAEYYLNEPLQANGNLSLRMRTFGNNTASGPGALDEVDGDINSVRQWRSKNQQWKNGIDQWTGDDVLYRPAGTPENSDFLNQAYWDVDSPGFLGMNVLPIGTQSVVAFVGGASATVDYRVINKSYSVALDYLAAEDPVDETWITSVLPASGGPLAATGASDVVTVTVDPSAVAAGLYTANLLFSDDANSTEIAFNREISLEVKECDWTVKPETTQFSKIEADMTVFGRCTDPTSYDFTVTSLGGADVSYTVDEVQSDGVTVTDYTWLDLAKTSGGPIPSGSYDTLTITVTSDDTDKTAYLLFTPSCGGGSIGVDPVVRRIDVTRLVTSDLGEKAFKHAYLGDVDPMAVDSCGVGCTFEIHTAVNSKLEAVGTVVADGEAQNGTAFYISTAVTGRHGYQSHTTDATHTDVRDFISGKLGFTMVARLKVHVNQNASGLIWAWSNSRTNADPVRNYPKCGYNMTWGGNGPSVPGKVREYQITAPPFDDINDRTSAVLADSTERLLYQVIRIVNGFGTYGDRTLAVYYDEQPDPVLFLDEGVLGATQSTGDHDSFCFGTFGASASAEVWYDWISFTNQGMYAPGEEVDC